MEQPLRYLHIAAHPDDLDFGCAGTTAGLVAAGNEVVYCLVTDGQAGGSDNTISRDEMASIRRDEQRAAAKVVGVTDIRFLGFGDGTVVADLDLRRAIARVIRQVRPDRVITQSPLRNFDRVYASHPDHLATGEAALNAVYPDARNEFAFPELLADEGLTPHTVAEVWLMGGPDADLWFDITDTVDAKIDALLCHHSQMRAPAELPAMIRQWGLDLGRSAGFDEGRLAEGFRRVVTS